MTNLTQLSSVQLYLRRDELGAKAVDAELDRRNRKASPRRRRFQMADTYRETNRWHVDDSGNIHEVQA